MWSFAFRIDKRSIIEHSGSAVLYTLFLIHSITSGYLQSTTMLSEKSFEIIRVFIQLGYAAKVYPFFLLSQTFEIVLDDDKWKWIRKRLYVTVAWSYLSSSYFIVHGVLNYVDMSSFMMALVISTSTSLGAAGQMLYLSHMPSFLNLWNSLIRLNQMQGQLVDKDYRI